MAKYRDVRSYIMEALSDGKWHTTDELQKICENHGVVFLNGKGPIYNILYQQKKAGRVEADGTGAYRILKETQNENMREEENEDVNRAFTEIEKIIIKYKKFDWVNCTDDELKEARYYSSRLLILASTIQNEFGR